MKLLKIELTNWKCFKQKTVQFEESISLLRWANGTGKSSLIEAIIFCFTDKRPRNLDYDSLRNDLTKNCRIVLSFEYNLSTYIIEREFGISSSYRLYKDGQMISRSRADNKAHLSKIIPDIVIDGLWGYNSLANSRVLETNYLFDLMENEFAEPLALKKHFQGEKTFYQRQVSAVEKTISNQSVTQQEIDSVQAEINTIEAKLKEKAFVSDRLVAQAKECEQAYPEYLNIKQRLEQMSPPVYDRELCVKLHKYGIKTPQEWDNFFKGVEQELYAEQNKAAQTHPLAKYPKNVIDGLLAEGQQSGRCLCCGQKYIPVKVTYNNANQARIKQLSETLQDSQYSFIDYISSVRYYQVKKMLDDKSFVNNMDWQTILNNYNQETNALYDRLAHLKEQLSTLTQDMAKITDLLNYKQQYNDAKVCVDIVDEYVTQAKEVYANSITSVATKILTKINPRYSKLLIENGIYKVVVHNEDLSSVSTLAVQALSMGEKTIVALSLILAIRNLFVPNIPLIMDEAFANLDSGNLTAVNDVIAYDKSQWVIVSHDERIATAIKTI
jgi:DNA repair exonuclease SbcCD ATPase subunit